MAESISVKPNCHYWTCKLFPQSIISETKGCGFYSDWKRIGQKGAEGHAGYNKGSFSSASEQMLDSFRNQVNLGGGLANYFLPASFGEKAPSDSQPWFQKRELNLGSFLFSEFVNLSVGSPNIIDKSEKFVGDKPVVIDHHFANEICKIIL